LRRAVICRDRGKGHVQISMHEIKPGAKFDKHIFYCGIID